MTNLILLIVLLAAGWIGVFGKFSRARIFACLAVILAVLVYVSVQSVLESGSWGPALGLGAFVGMFGLIYSVKRL